MSDVQPVLIDGEWRAAHTEGTFEPHNPTAQSPTGEVYPVSSLNDVEAVVRAGSVAAEEMAGLAPTVIASFLERYAERIEARADELVEIAHTESGLPASPRRSATAGRRRHVRGLLGRAHH